MLVADNVHHQCRYSETARYHSSDNCESFRILSDTNANKSSTNSTSTNS